MPAVLPVTTGRDNSTTAFQSPVKMCHFYHVKSMSLSIPSKTYYIFFFSLTSTKSVTKNEYSWMQLTLVVLNSIHLPVTCLHFLTFLKTEMAQVVEIFPHGRQGPIFPKLCIPWLLINWQYKEPGHHQPWHCTDLTRIMMKISQFQHQEIEIKHCEMK